MRLLTVALILTIIVLSQAASSHGTTGVQLVTDEVTINMGRSGYSYLSSSKSHTHSRRIIDGTAAVYDMRGKVTAVLDVYWDDDEIPELIMLRKDLAEANRTIDSLDKLMDIRLSRELELSNAANECKKQHDEIKVRLKQFLRVIAESIVKINELKAIADDVPLVRQKEILYEHKKKRMLREISENPGQMEVEHKIDDYFHWQYGKLRAIVK